MGSTGNFCRLGFLPPSHPLYVPKIDEFPATFGPLFRIGSCPLLEGQYLCTLKTGHSFDKFLTIISSSMENADNSYLFANSKQIDSSVKLPVIQEELGASLQHFRVSVRRQAL